jgi:hypothetical protein
MMPETREPKFHFFRATPPELLARPPLASSLQSLETTFFLLGLQLYPSALVSCATAWESVIKAKLGLAPDDGTKLAKLLGDIREGHPALKNHERPKIDDFRRVRNRIVHYGFSPKDDRECGLHLLETGFPFLFSMYRELFDFHVNWHDIRQDLDDFMKLSDDEKSRAGLLPEVADQVQIVNEMHRLNHGLPDFDPLVCFTAFSHFIRVGIKDGQRTNAEKRLSGMADSSGMRFDAEETEKKLWKNEIKGESWDFDCPICNGAESLVVFMDESSLARGEVKLTRGVCVSCHLFIPENAHHLAGLLLARELENKRPLILQEYH